MVVGPQCVYTAAAPARHGDAPLPRLVAGFPRPTYPDRLLSQKAPGRGVVTHTSNSVKEQQL